jgi:phenylalanyl-tRNA synthetase beta chain
LLVPLEWLRDFVDIPESAEEISEALTMAGLETALKEDGILEIDITPNRADCLSVAGIAREIAAIKNRKFRLNDYRFKHGFKPDFKVVIDSPLCRRYAGRIIRGVNIDESPNWMKKRLEVAGIRSINNVVDITNYVMLELGHPLHAFDLRTLRGNMIRVDVADSVREFVTLDGQKRLLSPDALLIWDGERPVALAGIMGGEETEVKEDTTDVFLESAYFEPSSIRRTSKALGLKTESSYRFERGTDIEGLINALDRAASLISEICGGEVSDRIDTYSYPLQPKSVYLRFQSVKRILGIEISPDEITEILKNLGFIIQNRDDRGLNIEIPTFRVDISMETDIIEEIARLYGYQNIPSTVPKAEIKSDPPSYLSNTLRNIKQVLLFSGFSESINYSFMNPLMLDLLRISPDDRRRETIELLNPLRKDESVLRTFLLPSLLHCLILNINRGVMDIKLFEISRVFFRTDEELPEERLHLGAVYFYKRGQRLWETSTEVYYIMKGIVEKLVSALNIKGLYFESSREPFVHKGKSADLLIGDKRVGYVGVLSPEVRDALDLKEPKEDIGIMELDIESLLEGIERERKFKPLPKYPAVQRDISLVVPRELKTSDVLGYLQDYPSELIEDIRIFDLYEGKNIPKGMKSLGISIVYRADNRTLTDPEVDSLHAKIVDYLIEKTGGRLR